MLVMAISIAGCASYKGRVAGDRYFSPNGEFSIQLPFARHTPLAETVYPDHAYVDFMLEGAETTYGVFGLQTVEWIALPKPISSAEFAENVLAVAKEQVEKRFSNSGGRFAFQNGVLLEKSAEFEYHFFATGQYRGRYTAWEGVVVHLGDRIAFVSFVIPVGALNYSAANAAVMSSKISAGLAKWKDTLRREP